MSFEFTLLDALQALRCPVLDALAVFFDQAGARGRSGSHSRRFCWRSGAPAGPGWPWRWRWAFICWRATAP